MSNSDILNVINSLSWPELPPEVKYPPGTVMFVEDQAKKAGCTPIEWMKGDY